MHPADPQAPGDRPAAPGRGPAAPCAPGPRTRAGADLGGAGSPAAASPVGTTPPTLVEILRFAVPLMLGLLTTAIHTFVDTVFMGRLGTAPLAAVPLAYLAYVVGWVLLIGLMRNAIAFCGRAYGAGRRGEIGTIVAHYHYLALLGFPLVWVYVQGWPLFAAAARLSPEVDGLARIYLGIRVWDVVFSLLVVLYSAFYQSLGNSRFPLVVSAVVVALNIVLDYGLIFGRLGLPALGVAGSALATVLAQSAGAVVIVGASFASRHRVHYALRLVVRPRWPLMRDILRVGLPSGLGDTLDVTAWVGFMLIVGRLGEAPLAASNIGVQVTHLIFLPGLAFGIAAASYNGRFLGAKRPHLAAHTTNRVLALGVAYMAVLGVPLWFAGEAIAALFTADAEVIRQAGLMFKVMALYQAFDGMGFITRVALGGAGDTRTPVLLQVGCAAAVLFPAAWMLSLLVQPPLVGAWLGAFAYILVYAAAMQWRRAGRRWTRIRLAVDAGT